MVGASHSLVDELLALLASRRPAFYARHRELLLTAATLHMAIVVHILSGWGRFK